MGGFAALHLAFRHPENFHGVGALSPALFINPPADRLWQFGSSRDANDPLRLAESAAIEHLRLFAGYGDHDYDWIEEGTDELARRLGARGLPFRSMVVDGGHEEATWRALAPAMLGALLPTPCSGRPPAPQPPTGRVMQGTMLGPASLRTSPVAASQPEVSRVSQSLPRPGGLIFDLDGTLVDTVSARIDGWLEALRDTGIAAEPDVVGPLIGMDGKRLAREVAAAAGRTLSEDEVEAVDKAAGAAFDRLNRAPRPLPGVARLLQVIEDSATPWVIATSSRKEQVISSVASLGLTQQPEIVDGSHVEHAKPAPDLLLLAAKGLGVEPGRCWAVGDSTWDMRAAVAGGIVAIGVMAGSAVSESALREAGASLVVGTLGDLAELLRPE
jgi:HAD superfamily hydrolase (TIGR01509 family)